MSDVYRIEINGSDVSELVLCSRKSIRISRSIGQGSRANASLTVFSRDGLYRPEHWQTVVIYDGETVIFSGHIETLTETSHAGTPALEYDLTCIDKGAMLDKRFVAKYYWIATGSGVPSIMITDILGTDCADLGITFDGSQANPEASPEIESGELLFNWVPASRVFSQILNTYNWDWYVDLAGAFWQFDRSVGIGAAPYTISDEDGLWREMTVRRDAKQYANRVGIRNSRTTTNTHTDTYTGAETAGRFIWITAFPMTSTPVVRVNGVQQTVTDVIGDDWYTIDRFTVCKDTTDPPLTASDVLTIEYVSPLAPIHWTQDEAEIAARGRIDHIEEAKDIPEQESIELYAAGILARKIEVPTEVSFKTLLPGWEPGQIVSINTSNPLCQGDFIIDRVESSEITKSEMWHTISCKSRLDPTGGGAAGYFGKLVERTQQPADRILERITFVLAARPEGSTGGLSVGAKEAIRVAQKDGVCRMATLCFYSIDYDGISTTEDIEIDILRNGESIFNIDSPPGDKLIYPSGTTGVLKHTQFLEDPLKVSAGDVFTIEIIQADEAAYSGTLELTIWG